MKTAVVCGAGGFIGSHLVKALKQEGYFVFGIDLKKPEFSPTRASQFVVGDLRDKIFVERFFDELCVDEIYQLAADMGGAGYIFTGKHDDEIMHNSAMINLNVAEAAIECQIRKPGLKYFFSSSACIYPAYNQTDPNNPLCFEPTAYPAAPDSEYGWEKLFTERLLLAYQRNKGLDVRIARFHNIFGPEGSYNNGKEKAPAAMCRKVAEAKPGEFIEIWGDGEQTRSFLYIDECIKGIRKLMKAPTSFEPLNIGSEEMVTINQLAEMVMKIAGKHFPIDHIPGPLGVRGRCSDNKLIQQKLGWSPNYSLFKGLIETYHWINKEING